MSPQKIDVETQYASPADNPTSDAANEAKFMPDEIVHTNAKLQVRLSILFTFIFS